ncbi:MAG: hypothetical protein JXR83_10130 [Deltaproteobacteria bacterium]|nr:hypothetical protein [Deltaproteobacteria bacterium]
MHVGAVGYGYGTSRLWHDPDYIYDRPLFPTRVERPIDTQLPYQEHLLPPELPSDPYIAQEKSYDVAFAQMTRGIEGRDFLHGIKKDAAFDLAVQSQQIVVQHQQPARDKQIDPMVMVNAAIERQLEGLPIAGQVRASNATTTEADIEQKKAAEAMRDHNQVTEALAATTSMVATAVGAGMQAQVAQMVNGAATQVATALPSVVTTSASSVSTAQATEEALAYDAPLRTTSQPRQQLVSGLDPTQIEAVDPSKQTPEK